ncbi:histidine kinase N-terminal 7TM domain-containing protein [Natrarchaeobaculum sulfurireducens]|uniref:histidine kinase n=1 Tax=Natrarchaeobaculum sulfurireducens TaxID=2044521 RepID=A0A346PLF4_9EURY|nr:histidine kinase N-terminal 7TM domain-containing protein [Natrarchaeobaculum sulfurireducens]AXR80349.1 signal-transducing histidine kinase [Natrarchaeobaculum sulfurireducens]
MNTGQAVAGSIVVATCFPIATMLWLAHRHSHTPGSRGLSVTLVGFFFWNLASGLIIVHPTETTFRGLWGLRLFAANLIAIGWAVIALEYTRRRRLRLGYLGWSLLFAIPLLTQVLYATNTWHHLVVHPTTTVTGIGALEVEHGWWFYVHTTYNYAVLGLGGVALLLADAVRSSGIHRRQTLILFVGFVVAAVAALGFTVEVPLPAYVDPGPFGFLVTASLWTAAVFRYRLFTLVPVARRNAVETIPDALVVVDATGHVADVNEAATDLFDVDEDVLGMRVATLFSDHPSLLERLESRREFETELSIVDSGQVRHVSLTVTPLSIDSNDVGTILMLRDITSLKTRQQEFELLQQLFSRVLRHNLRTELQYIRGYAEEIADGETDPARARQYAETIVERADELERTSQKARRIENVLGTSHERSVHDLRSILTETVTALEAACPDVDATCVGPGEAWVTAHPELQSAVANLLENAIVHAERDEPRVEVTITERDETIQTTIEDNGPGIPADELEALRNRSESALEHGSGAGLWLTDWVIEKSGGELTFEVTDAGTTATATLPKADAVNE